MTVLNKAGSRLTSVSYTHLPAAAAFGPAGSHAVEREGNGIEQRGLARAGIPGDQKQDVYKRQLLGQHPQVLGRLAQLVFGAKRAAQRAAQGVVCLLYTSRCV